MSITRKIILLINQQLSQKINKIQVRKRRIFKRAFTLLEITLCMALLGVISSLLIWNLKGMLIEQEFRKSVERILLELNKAQMLALTYNTDLQLHIFKEDGKFLLEMRSDCPMKLIKSSKKILLKRVVDCWIKERRVENIQLQVYSNGRIEPAVILTFYRQDLEQNEHRRGINLDFSMPLAIKMIETDKSENNSH